MKKVTVFFGTRPEAIKMAPVIKALEKAKGITPIVISTGQHKEMLEQVVNIFDLKVDYNLEIMEPNQTLSSLTSRLIAAIDKILGEINPDLALVQGDTTTAMVGSLVSFYHQIPVGHVEAGLRTNDIYSPFPEEVNRRLISPIVTLNFAPTILSESNLLKENVSGEKIFVTGNTVIDALFMESARQENPAITDAVNATLSMHLPQNWRGVPYVLITGHRRENFGCGFDQICAALAQLAELYPDYRFIYPVHLNPSVQKPVYSLLGAYDNIFLIPPQDYSVFLALMAGSKIILTDSGGIQEEAPSLGKPVLVMRDTTERPEGLDANTVRLVGAKTCNIVDSVVQLLNDETLYRTMSTANNPFGDGHAAERIVKTIEEYFQ